LLVALAAGVGIAAAVDPGRGPDAAPIAERGVIAVAGFRSELSPVQARGRVVAGIRFRRFSYRGVDAHGRPLPYGPRATYQSLELLTAKLARQVAVLHRMVPGPIALVAESEGTLVAKLYLLRHPRAPVDRLVMLSPILEPGRVYYPPPGGDGWGVASGFAARRVGDLVSALVRRTAPGRRRASGSASRPGRA
jgi:alpha-beta hydrolase superfamily lysophospholipase